MTGESVPVTKTMAPDNRADVYDRKEHNRYVL